MTIPEKILAALQKAPQGLTSRELAEATGMPFVSVSSCVSRMHSYGKLERESVREVRTVEHEATRWRTKKG